MLCSNYGDKVIVLANGICYTFLLIRLNCIKANLLRLKMPLASRAQGPVSFLLIARCYILGFYYLIAKTYIFDC